MYEFSLGDCYSYYFKYLSLNPSRRRTPTLPPRLVVVSWDANKCDLQLSFISHWVFAPKQRMQNGILVSFVQLRNNSRRNEGTTPEKRFKFDTAGAKSFLLGLLTVVKSPGTYFWHFFNVPFLRSGLYQLCQMRARKLSDLLKQNFQLTRTRKKAHFKGFPVDKITACLFSCANALNWICLCVASLIGTVHVVFHVPTIIVSFPFICYGPEFRFLFCWCRGEWFPTQPARVQVESSGYCM